MNMLGQIVRDKNGKVPTYVIEDGRMFHQMSGLSVSVVNLTHAKLRHARAALRRKLKEAGVS